VGAQGAAGGGAADHGRAKRGYVLLFLVQTANLLPALLLAAGILLLARPWCTRRRRRSAWSPMSTSCSISRRACRSRSDRSRRRPAGAPLRRGHGPIDKFTTYRAGDAFGLTVYARYFLHWVR